MSCGLIAHPLISWVFYLYPFIPHYVLFILITYTPHNHVNAFMYILIHPFSIHSLLFYFLFYPHWHSSSLRIPFLHCSCFMYTLAYLMAQTFFYPSSMSTCITFIFTVHLIIIHHHIISLFFSPLSFVNILTVAKCSE